MADQGNARIAVLIDADNTSGTHSADLLAEIAKYGVATVKRAYGDWTTSQLAGWKKELNRAAITPVQQFAYTRGKNSTDSALIIDAMDLLYSDKVDAFAIVSSDSDFTRLATRLRESGLTVYGMGRRKTPESFVAACDRFIFLENLGSHTADDDEDDEGDDSAATTTGATHGGKRDEQGGGSSDPAATSPPPLRRLLSRAIEATSGDDGWVALGLLGNYLSNSSASFDPRTYGHAKLSALVRAQDFVEVKGSGHQMHVRYIPRRRASARSSGTAK